MSKNIFYFYDDLVQNEFISILNQILFKPDVVELSIISSQSNICRNFNEYYIKIKSIQQEATLVEKNAIQRNFRY